MAWIKRNLFFVIGSVVALALIGLGGWFFYTEYKAEKDYADQINQQYGILTELNGNANQPGKAGQGSIDNVQAAKDQTMALRTWIQNIRATFQPIKLSVSGPDFPAQLDRVVTQLQEEAASAGVGMTKNYYFTFQAQKNMLGNPGAKLLGPLTVRLAEIKAICDILFEAKINKFEYIKREMLEGETNSPDYLSPNQKTATTPLAVMTPYEVQFRCFSGELASVLGKLAASPYGLVVKSINVESATAAPKAVPAPSARGPVSFLTENQLVTTLRIEVVKPAEVAKPGSGK